MRGSERFTCADELRVLKPAGDTPVAVRGESIEGYCGSSVDSRIHEVTIENRFARLIDDIGSSGAIGVDEPYICIRFIVWSLNIAVTERCLDGRESGYCLSVSTEIPGSVVVGGLDCLPDLCNSHLVALRNDERDAVLWCSTVDEGWLPYMAA